MEAVKAKLVKSIMKKIVMKVKRRIAKPRAKTTRAKKTARGKRKFWSLNKRNVRIAAITNIL